MPSLLPGFEYDIFISYRQNDNRSGWVTGFVDALREELAATIKDPITVYVDSNPHDGLLETHHVDKSLLDKLKCAIFLPVISQTYCDPKGFAWANEFCAFNRLANEGSIGRDVKLGNGNVASRILPVRIHDLDAEDNAALEKEIGGPLRAIEFIYKEAGVNRPLTPDDPESKNLNKTKYKNQVNKVANAVKDIVTSLKNPAAKPASPYPARGTRSDTDRKRYAFAFLSIVLVAAAYFIYKVTTASPSTKSADPSIAVLPFVDLTPEKNMEYFGDGIADEIINSLTTIKDLKIAGRTSSFQFKGEKVDLRTVGERLQVGYVLEGSVQKYEDNFRITAQLIRTEDNFHAWSQRFDLHEVNIFKIQDLIAAAVVEKLRLTLSDLERNQLTKRSTSQEAYTEYLKGLHLWKAPDYKSAIPYFRKVIQLDSTYAPAYAYMGLGKGFNQSGQKPNPDSVNEALYYATKATTLDPTLPEGYSAVALISWINQRDFAKAKVFFEKSIELKPSSSLTRNRYSYFLTWMGDFAKAAEMSRAAILLDPIDWNSYLLLFDSAVFNNDTRAASRILADYRRLLGPDGRWQEMSLDLDYVLNNHAKLIHYLDSLQATRKPLDAWQVGLMARSQFKLGNKHKSDSLLRLLVAWTKNSEFNSCFSTALVYAVTSNADSCFYYLTLAADRYEVKAITLKIEPELEPLHNDPRYSKLYKAMGFDKY